MLDSTPNTPHSTPMSAPIGIFDSGYGGLTILKEIVTALPDYDFLYLGDNARAPYGTRSFDIVYDFTLQAVQHLFAQGAPLVILACNTASAKALRSIQQKYLPISEDPSRRVLGVIRPTVEVLKEHTKTGHVGILATPGTINSHSYQMEIEKMNPGMQVSELACPMWVPLVETGEFGGPGADYFVKKYVDQILEDDPEIDTLILGCTHYPLLYPKIREYTPEHIRILPQGELVAESLTDYLKRHPEMDSRLSKNGCIEYLTTESCDKFNPLASLFLDRPVSSSRIHL